MQEQLVWATDERGRYVASVIRRSVQQALQESGQRSTISLPVCKEGAVHLFGRCHGLAGRLHAGWGHREQVGAGVPRMRQAGGVSCHLSQSRFYFEQTSR